MTYVRCKTVPDFGQSYQNDLAIMKAGYVYIMGNDRPTLYTGVINNLVKRVFEHKNNKSYFTRRYQMHKLLYYEYCETIEQAIIREKQIKDMNRKDKLAMIQKINPNFKDLYSWILDKITH